jgi:RecA/RadA recombinase
MFTESTLDFPLQDSRCNEDECGPVEKELRETIARIPVGPIALDRVASSPIRWLWPGRVPLGGLTLLAGDPGVGKSLLTLDLAARVSRGAPWPDELEQESDTQNMALPNPQSAIRNPQFKTSPSSVLLLTAEDDLADTIRPRLDAAGADCSRIVAQPMLMAMSEYISREAGIERAFELRGNVNRLRFMIRDLSDCRLLVIDSMNMFLSDNTTRSKNKLPNILLRLAGLARESGLAVVVITHFRKKEGLALHRTLGSLAFVATARVAWAVTRDPDDPNRRLLLPIKNNLSAGTSGLAFTIESAAPNGAPTIHWLPATHSTAAEVEMHGSLPRGRPDDERQQAKSWLRQRLSTGPCAVKEIQTEADANGFSRGTLRRAFRDLEGKAIRESPHPNSTWFWQLPGTGAHNSVGEYCASVHSPGDCAITDHSRPQHPASPISPQTSKISDTLTPDPRPLTSPP